MNAAAVPRAEVEHPAPHRDLVAPWSLWFAILAGPLAWAAQLLVNVSLFGHGCYPHDLPLAKPIWGHLRSIAFLIEGVAAAVCVLAGSLALRNWQRTRHEKTGTESHLLGGGDGRTRFLAMVGLLCCALFLVAIAFSSLNLTSVPACGG